MDPRSREPWRPGSFTKNFSWGPPSGGLRQLHESIRVGFDGELKDVPRKIFRNRLTKSGRIDYIPANFFLYNKVVDGVDYIIVDELVFQALEVDHSRRFDRLALTAFNLSNVGRWQGAASYQKYPALWAHYYVRDRVGNQNSWDTRIVSADDIEKFVLRDERYDAQTARKLATNLNYLFKIGSFEGIAALQIERWWVDALFLVLDRAIEDATESDFERGREHYASLISAAGFPAVSGPWNTEKALAAKHLSDLYYVCGGRDRFADVAQVKERSLSLPDVAWLLHNDPRPRGAVHPSNPAILKSIPRACASLALYAGFEDISPDELTNFDPVEWVRTHTRRALDRIRARGIKPTMTSEELLKITREK